LLAQRKVTKRNGLKVQPYFAVQPVPGFFDGTSVSHRKTAVFLTAALRVHDCSGAACAFRNAGLAKRGQVHFFFAEASPITKPTSIAALPST
jgi:hypothetical protein